jgi:hypothetical protein
VDANKAMGGQRLSRGSVLAMLGNLAIALGFFLAIALVRIRSDGSTIILVPGAGLVGALALVFMVAGAGVRCRVPLALELLGAAFVTLTICQVLAAAEALDWITGLQHTLFAVWLGGGVFVLWLHRREARRSRRLP